MPIDYTRYPPNWKTEIRPRIMRRAQNCCEDCDAEHGRIIARYPKNTWHYINAVEQDMIKAKINYSGYTYAGALKILGFTKVCLTIAHLDHDPENWEVKDERLKALCQRCHLLYDMKHHVQNRKYGRDWKKQQITLNL